MATNFNEQNNSDNVDYDDFADDDCIYDNVDDLWDDKGPTIPSIQIKELRPQDIAEYDSRNQSVILSNTNALHTTLYFCDKIVDGCFKVANYVPNLSIDQNASFWHRQVIPILAQNIVNISRARVVVSHSISSVRRLGIAILRGAEIINETRGSPKSIEIARRDIAGALAALGQCIQETEKVEGLSVHVLERQILEIFSITGPDSATFVVDKSNIEKQIYDAEGKQKQLLVDIGHKEGVMERNRHLYLATKKHLDRLNKTVETDEGRIDSLSRWNDYYERTINRIQATTINIRTTVEHRKWWSWWSDKRKKNAAQTANAERDREKAYYEGIILARMKRLRENQGNVNSNRKIADALNRDFAEYVSAFKTSEAELRAVNKDFKGKMAKYQKDIDSLNEKLDEMKRNQNSIEQSIGLQGHTLVQCLVDIRAFSKLIEKGTSAFSSLVAILGDIRQMVQSDIELLSSDSEIDINTATRRLMSQVQFFTRYAVDANEILKPSSDIPIEKLVIEGSSSGAVLQLRN